MVPLPIIHINGFPGTGKLTIATALLTLSPALKLVHNHLLINPCDAVLHRTQPGYQDLRKSVRAAIFTSLIHEPATWDTAYVFTDFQSSDSQGASVCEEFRIAAAEREAEFIPIVLNCAEDENLRRLVERDRVVHRKLVDVDLVRRFRREEEVHRFSEHLNLLELDVSDLSVEEAARRIWEHVLSVCPVLDVGE